MANCSSNKAHICSKRTESKRGTFYTIGRQTSERILHLGILTPEFHKCDAVTISERENDKQRERKKENSEIDQDIREQMKVS
jgi:hypothetical protein